MPSKDHRMPLHVAKSMKELQQMSDLKSLGSTNARILVKSAEKVFKEAEKFDSKGDEESAFIMYMKYFNIVKVIRSSADYKKSKQFFDQLIGPRNQVLAIEKAEKLADSLKERYEFREAEAVANKLAELDAVSSETEKKDESKTGKGSSVVNVEEKSPSTSQTNGQVSFHDDALTPLRLCGLLRDPSTQLIIMDTRLEADFLESHINHPSCISVPQDIIPPGTTVTYIESQLPDQSKSLWQQRGNCDLIVLVDWSSNKESVTVGTTLQTLKDALFKYDSTVIIKSEPAILEGGYEQWLLFYPMLTTNPRVSRPGPLQTASSVTSLDFDYPDFDEGSKSEVQRNVDIQSNSQLDGFAFSENSQSTSLGLSKSMPQFDRSLKPKTVAGTVAEALAKPTNLNNARNLNVDYERRTGEGLNVLSNTLYPSVTASKRPEKNTNIYNEQMKAAERNAVEEAHVSSQGHPSPADASLRLSQLEEAEAAKLQELADKRRQQEKELAELMRKKRKVEEEMRAKELLAEEQQKKLEEAQKMKRQEEMKREQERLRKEEETRKELQRMEKEHAEAAQRREEETREQERLKEEEVRKQEQQQIEREHTEVLKKQEEARVAAQKNKEMRLAEEQKHLLAEEQKRLLAEEQKRLLAEEQKRLLAEEQKRLLAEEQKRLLAEEQKRLAAEEQKQLVTEEQKRLVAERSLAVNQDQNKIRQAQESKMIPSPTLPAGWEKRLDNATHRYYYIDHNRGMTQWEAPTMTTSSVNKEGTYKDRLKDEPVAPSRGGLTRSHSSPDIMKQLASEAKVASQMPIYDRGKKPTVEQPDAVLARPVIRQVARKRDLNPVYGNVGSALTGLRNLGNTCYMNSTIQCLNNTTPLVTYFLNDHYLGDINRDSSSGMYGEVVDEFAIVVKALWSGQYRCITPRDLKNTVGKYNPIFAGYQQQDSQEFLTFLLDGLHEGLNEVKDRPQIPEQNNDHLPDHEAAKLAWQNHKLLHRSIIVELFQGQLKSTLLCKTCGKKSVTFQACMYISLPIPSSNRCTLKDCLQAFLQPEMMTGNCKWKCPQCNVEREAEKKMDIWKLPPILLIGLNRFVSDGMWLQKKTTYVDFPVTDLDMSEFTIGSKPRSRYNLYGISNHYGTMEGGHYTAYCRNPCTTKWHKFDDHEVYEMSKSDVKSAAAFVLYYTSIELKAPKFKPRLKSQDGN